VSTLAQVQADTMSDEVKRLVIADQFAQDWLLVAMNDADSYSELMSDASRYNSTAELSDNLRTDWERLAEMVTELVAENISPTASLFIAQILQGQGSLPFDIIARDALKTYEETK
jgi:hypothetical protein